MMSDDVPNEIDRMRELASGYLEEVKRLSAENARLRTCLGFFASVIKCGEPWTDTCEAEYRKAKGDV